LNLGYPSHEDEVMILEREEHADPLEAITSAVNLDEILQMQQTVRTIDVIRPLKDYIVRIAAATRTHGDVVLGASPRGGVALQRCAQALALLRNRTYVIPDDIKAAAPAVLAHRMMTRDRGAETAHNIITDVLSKVRVPVE
jgi:MoxR-like ATPase